MSAPADTGSRPEKTPLQQMQELMEQYDRVAPRGTLPASMLGDSCPRCGYCRHCGRGGHMRITWGSNSLLGGCCR